jgi:hypothetical protein
MLTSFAGNKLDWIDRRNYLDNETNMAKNPRKKSSTPVQLMEFLQDNKSELFLLPNSVLTHKNNFFLSLTSSDNNLVSFCHD